MSGRCPYELVYGFQPVFTHLRNFGCLCFAINPNISGKCSSSSEKCILLGYANSRKGYRLFSIDSNKVIVSRDVKFYENVFPFKMSLNKQDKSTSDDLNTLNFFDLVVVSSNGFSSSSSRLDDEVRDC